MKKNIKYLLLKLSVAMFMGLVFTQITGQENVLLITIIMLILSGLILSLFNYQNAILPYFKIALVDSAVFGMVSMFIFFVSAYIKDTEMRQILFGSQSFFEKIIGSYPLLVVIIFCSLVVLFGNMLGLVYKKSFIKK